MSVLNLSSGLQKEASVLDDHDKKCFISKRGCIVQLSAAFTFSHYNLQLAIRS